MVHMISAIIVLSVALSACSEAPVAVQQTPQTMPSPTLVIATPTATRTPAPTVTALPEPVLPTPTAAAVIEPSATPVIVVGPEPTVEAVERERIVLGSPPHRDIGPGDGAFILDLSEVRGTYATRDEDGTYYLIEGVGVLVVQRVGEYETFSVRNEAGQTRPLVEDEYTKIRKGADVVVVDGNEIVPFGYLFDQGEYPDISGTASPTAVAAGSQTPTPVEPRESPSFDVTVEDWQALDLSEFVRQERAVDYATIEVLTDATPVYVDDGQEFYVSTADVFDETLQFGIGPDGDVWLLKIGDRVVAAFSPGAAASIGQAGREFVLLTRERGPFAEVTLECLLDYGTILLNIGDLIYP